MEMEDHHHQYGSMADLRQLMNGRSAHLIPSPNIPSTAAADHHHHHLFSPAPPPPQPTFEMMMMGRPVSAVEIIPRGFPHPHHPHHHHHHDFRSDNNSAGNSTASITAVAATTNSAPSTVSGGNGGLEVETGGYLGGDGGTGRWPRQETLTLLEIRSRLDSKFKEANQKGPLWDEVSRIMSDEHGYQRSGKKCREKFENLYKYYKKTKEGKAGRQDGKHYRFFRQLEALYGETSSNQVGVATIPDHQHTQYVSNNHLQFLTSANPTTSTHQLAYNSNQSHNNSLSLSTSSEFESSSSDDNDSSEKRRSRRGGSRGWKAKIKEFIDSQMRKLMEKQEAWLEKLVKTLEQKEKERSVREEEWRKQEADRIEKEHKFWAKERAWIEARDSALMEALKNLTGKEIVYNGAMIACSSSPEKLAAGESLNQDHDQDGSTEIENNSNHHHHHHDPQNNWPEPEITRLIQLRTSMDSRFSQGGFSEEVLWEDIAAKMACLGYDRSGFMWKEKWESMNNEYVKKYSKESMTSKKRKENSRSGYNIDSSTSLYNHGGYNCDNQMNDGTNNNNSSPSPSNANVGSSTHDHTCFPAFLMGDQGSENLWENYGLKINKGGQNQ